MPVYALTDALVFPPVHLAEPDGLLAAGGDLTVARLLLAYQSGLFPWFSQGDPILWWSPDPRMMMRPNDAYRSKSMQQVLRRQTFRITFDQAFDAVIEACSEVPRAGQRGTWITTTMMEAYQALHREGFAHSVEAWQGDQLVGGLYGVSIGTAFFGESMFTRVSNASKAAFLTLCQCLEEEGFSLIDCQVYTDHLASLGAYEAPRPEFLDQLRQAVAHPTRRGNWGKCLTSAK